MARWTPAETAICRAAPTIDAAAAQLPGHSRSAIASRRSVLGVVTRRRPRATGGPLPRARVARPPRTVDEQRFAGLVSALPAGANVVALIEMLRDEPDWRAATQDLQAVLQRWRRA